MKRRVKWIRQSKNGNIYTQPSIGYSYRNKNGVSDFCRKMSLNTLSKSEVDNIDCALRNGKNVKSDVGSVQLLDSLEIGAYWAAYCIAEKLGILHKLSKFEEKHKAKIRKAWRKLHIAIDEDGNILASTLTENNIDDGTELENLMNQIDGNVSLFLGDGAYDNSPVHEFLEGKLKSRNIENHKY